jgi:hypothetical protein
MNAFETTNPTLPATHRAYGLNWHFPFEFPPFRQVQAALPADVVVELGVLPALSPEARAAGPLRQVSAGTVRFGFPGVAKLLIARGNHILVEPHPQGSQQALTLLLMGTAAALLLLQRGVLPLHGSGIATARGAVLLVGHSGAGKSTTLGALLRRGYSMVCDDLAAVRFDKGGVPLVDPGVGLYKLWADSAEALGIDTDHLPRVRTELSKFMVPASHQLVDAPVPIYAVYQLSAHNQAEPRLEPKLDARKFNVLLNHTWQKLTVKALGLHGKHFQQASQLANAVRVMALHRPDRSRHNAVDVERVADLIEADFLG